jgi:hypothetical protein
MPVARNMWQPSLNLEAGLSRAPADQAIGIDAVHRPAVVFAGLAETGAAVSPRLAAPSRWGGYPPPGDREFESPILQRRVTQTRSS